MPELAEVEYFRKQWDAGLRQRILRVDLRQEKRIFRGTDTAAIERALPEALLLSSEANGKQMLFRFSDGLWLGLHLDWMADEILWRAGVRPTTRAGRLTNDSLQKLWKEIRFVCREAIKKVGKDFSDPPSGWLFHARWGRAGLCPKHQETLARKTIGGRTTAWCARCQTG